MAKLSVNVKALLLCEVAAESNGIWTLENPLASIVILPGIHGHRIKQLFLYTQLTGGLGSYHLSAQIRAFDSNVMLGRSETTTRGFPHERDMTIEQVFRFDNLMFPRSDLYEFQILANHVELQDGAVCLSIIIGE